MKGRQPGASFLKVLAQIVTNPGNCFLFAECTLQITCFKIYIKKKTKYQKTKHRVEWPGFWAETSITFLRVRFFKKIQGWILKSKRIRNRILHFFIKQINPRSFVSWCVKGTEESTSRVDSLDSFDVPWSERSWIELYGKETLTPTSHMGVGCPGTWGWSFWPQTQVARAPQKPALSATQPRAQPAI